MTNEPFPKPATPSSPAVKPLPAEKEAEEPKEKEIVKPAKKKSPFNW